MERALTILKVVAGIAGAMFVVWAGLYPSSGKRGMISPRFAAIAAALVGSFCCASCSGLICILSVAASHSS
jgi:drug/metabolite transporter (DMT)-like permease